MNGAPIQRSRSNALSENDSPKPKAKTTSPNINVTPLIDVLLVLLIIFMVISPRREAQFPIRIPDKPSEVDDPRPADILLLTMSDDFHLEMNTKPISLTDLPIVLASVMEQREAEATYRVLGNAECARDRRPPQGGRDGRCLC